MQIFILSSILFALSVIALYSISQRVHAILERAQPKAIVERWKRLQDAQVWRVGRVFMIGFFLLTIGVMCTSAALQILYGSWETAIQLLTALVFSILLGIIIYRLMGLWLAGYILDE